MQLFLSDFEEDGNLLTTKDIVVIKQLKRVLRAKPWLEIFFQKETTKKTVRYKIKLDKVSDKWLLGTILSSEEKNITTKHIKTMIIAMPNKWKKAELIVQKLTEIWIQHIIFWIAERSEIRVSNTNKMERLLTISKEATEQSWWRKCPKIWFTDNIKEILVNKNIIIFDKTNDKQEKTLIFDVWIIGPEGGLTEKDYNIIGEATTVKSLWDTVLRTETAAIVGGWWIVNQD